MKKKASGISSVERLFNLSAFLMTVPKPVPLRRILGEVEGYGAADFESERRKFLRDKNELKKLGINIRVVHEMECEGADSDGYIIDRKEMFLPEMNFTVEEMKALSGLGVWAVAGNPLHVELELALAKLSSASRASIGDALLFVELRSEEHRVDQNTIKAIREAVMARRKITISYKTGASVKESKRDVDPYGIFLVRGIWYLFGYCHARQSGRTFRLDRLKLIRVHSTPGDEPAFEIPDGFSLSNEMRRKAPWEFGDDPEKTVEIKFGADIFWQVKNSWGDLSSAKFDEEALSMTVRSVNDNALLHWVLEFAGGAEIISPPSLRRKITVILKGILGNAGTVG